MNSRALLIGMEAKATEALRAGGPRDFELEPLEISFQDLPELLQGPKEIDAVVLGPLESSPLSFLQELGRADRELGVLVLAPPKELDSLRALFQVSPFVGPRTQLRSSEDPPSLGRALQQTVRDTRQRRAHRRMIDAVNAQLSATAPPKRKSAAVLDSLLELAPVGILELDEAGWAHSANPAARAMLGKLSERLSSTPLWSMLPPDFRALVERARLTGKATRSSLEWTVQQRLQVLEITVAPMTESVLGRRGYLLVLQDVTSQVELLREREALVDALESAVQMRDEFLSVASHELRTPLTSMLGWVQLLRSASATPEKIARGLEVIERNARAQAQLIEDLLDVGRIVSGKLRLEVAQVKLDELIRQAVESIQPAAEAKSIQLQVLLDDMLAPATGDPQRLQQVIWNLLSNAVKFTGRGGHVEVRLRRLGSSAEISVRDDGEGIAPEFLPFVFDRFRQADATPTRPHGGLGLGLSIVRHLAELHGGRVSVASEGRGRGATFSVLLPIAPRGKGTPLAPVSIEESFECPQGLAGLRLLLVEEEPEVRALLTSMLERCQVEVTAVATAAEAWAAFEQRPPDVLLSDVGPPEQDGYSLIQRIRALPPERGGNVAAVALTAQGRAEDRKRAFRAGFQMHIGKPVALEELLLMVAAVARNSPTRALS